MTMNMIEKINHMTAVLKSERAPALSESENLVLSLRRHFPNHRSPEDTVRYMMEGDRDFCDTEASAEKEVPEHDRSMGEQITQMKQIKQDQRYRDNNTDEEEGTPAYA